MTVAESVEGPNLFCATISRLSPCIANRLAIVENGIFQVGPKQEILTASNMSNVYKMPVDVLEVGGSTIIIPLERHE